MRVCVCLRKPAGSIQYLKQSPSINGSGNLNLISSTYTKCAETLFIKFNIRVSEVEFYSVKTSSVANKMNKR